MLRRGARHLNFANVMSITAVFIALGGSAVAITLAKNSVGAKQIKAGAVRSVEVKDFSLQANDFAKGVLAAGQRGEPGPPGEKGTTGASPVVLSAFVQTGTIGAQPLDPPWLYYAHGVTDADIEAAGTGRYSVTFDAKLLPGGKVDECIPLVTNATLDAGLAKKGEFGVSRVNGLAPNQLRVAFRDSAGTEAELHDTTGNYGFYIVLFC